MDDNTRRRRQIEPPVNATSDARFSVHDPNAQRRSYGAGGSSDRYRPAPINTSTPAARGMGASTTYSGYYQEPATAFPTAIPQNAMPYQPEYGQDSRQMQGFGTYNPSLMYNVPQASAQTTVYDATQQFPSRQPAGMPMIPSDVAAPYFQNEPTNAATASSLQTQAESTGTPTVYQQSPAVQNYASGMGSMNSMAQTNAPDQVVEDQEYSASAEMGEAYQQYQSALKGIFTNIRDGALMTASESLLNVSDWLLSKVLELGLTADNSDLHSDRIKLWHDFNHAWLALLQKQKDMMEVGMAPQRGPSLITRDGLERMGKELVRLCDGIERHGLVDYEYGVWEERIIDIIGECIDLYPDADDAGPPGSSRQNHQASR